MKKIIAIISVLTMLVCVACNTAKSPLIEDATVSETQLGEKVFNLSGKISYADGKISVADVTDLHISKTLSVDEYKALVKAAMAEAEVIYAKYIKPELINEEIVQTAETEYAHIQREHRNLINLTAEILMAMLSDRIVYFNPNAYYTFNAIYFGSYTVFASAEDAAEMKETVALCTEKNVVETMKKLSNTKSSSIGKILAEVEQPGVYYRAEEGFEELDENAYFSTEFISKFNSAKKAYLDSVSIS